MVTCIWPQSYIVGMGQAAWLQQLCYGPTHQEMLGWWSTPGSGDLASLWAGSEGQQLQALPATRVLGLVETGRGGIGELGIGAGGKSRRWKEPVRGGARTKEEKGKAGMQEACLLSPPFQGCLPFPLRFALPVHGLSAFALVAALHRMAEWLLHQWPAQYADGPSDRLADYAEWNW